MARQLPQVDEVWLNGADNYRRIVVATPKEVTYRTPKGRSRTLTLKEWGLWAIKARIVRDWEVPPGLKD